MSQRIFGRAWPSSSTCNISAMDDRLRSKCTPGNPALPAGPRPFEPGSASLSRGFKERSDSGDELRESHRWVRKIRVPDLLPLEGQPTIEACSLKDLQGVFQGDFAVANLDVPVSQSCLEVGDGVLEIHATDPGTNIRPGSRN